MRVIVEQLVEWRLAGETEVLGENLPQHHFVYHKIPHDQAPGSNRVAAVGSQRLTAWAMARPFKGLKRYFNSCSVSNAIIVCLKEEEHEYLRM
jgi:hypothetical protein